MNFLQLLGLDQKDKGYICQAQSFSEDCFFHSTFILTFKTVFFNLHDPPISLN